MPLIPVRDIDIYYEVRGNGPRLLVISGTGGDLRRRLGIFDSPLAEQFEILAYDQRGLGRSSRPDVTYTMTDYAADAEALLTALDWDRCAVLGISFGGMVAQELALRFPARVERLVLACTSSGGAGGQSYPLHELGGLCEDARARKMVALSDTRRDAAWRAANTTTFERLVDDTLAGLAVGAGEPGRETGARRQLEARIGHDTYARLPQLASPTLVCGGRYDGIAPAVNLEALCRQIRDARLELFDGGHLFYLQDADAYRRIGEFLLEADK